MCGPKLLLKVLVLCCGNPLRSDDGVGEKVADFLRGQVFDPRVEVLFSLQYLPEWAEKLSQADYALFVDASVSGAPGTFKKEAVAVSNQSIPEHTHALNPQKLLGLAQALYGAHPQAEFFQIAGDSFEYGHHFSTSIEEAFPKFVHYIQQHLQEILET